LPENYTVKTVQTYYDTERQCRIADTTPFALITDVLGYVVANSLPSNANIQVASVEAYREIQIVKLLPYNSTMPKHNVRNLYDYTTSSDIKQCINDKYPAMKEDSADFSPIGDFLTLKLRYGCQETVDSALSGFAADTVQIAGYQRTLGEYSPTLDRFADFILSESIKRAGLVIADNRGGGVIIVPPDDDNGGFDDVPA